MQQNAKMRLNTQTVDEFGNALAEALMDIFTQHGPSAMFRNCDNCFHMSEQGPAHCSKFNATPPASVIVVGCDQHDDKEDIPF